MHDLISSVLKVKLSSDGRNDHVYLDNLKAELIQENQPLVLTPSLLDRTLLARLFQWDANNDTHSIFDYCLEVYQSALLLELKVKVKKLAAFAFAPFSLAHSPYLLIGEKLVKFGCIENNQASCCQLLGSHFTNAQHVSSIPKASPVARFFPPCDPATRPH